MHKLNSERSRPLGTHALEGTFPVSYGMICRARGRRQEMLIVLVAITAGFFRQSRPHFENSFPADVDGSRFYSFRLGNISGPGAGDGHHASGSRLAVKGGDGCRQLEGVAVGFIAGWDLEDYMTARHAAHMKPPVIGRGLLQAQPVVVRIAAAGQYGPAARQHIDMRFRSLRDVVPLVLHIIPQQAVPLLNS
jgi:hypothetical protein